MLSGHVRVSTFPHRQSAMVEKPQRSEYEPLNPNPSIDLEFEPESGPTLSLSPRIFWVILLVLLLSIFNSAFYPLTISALRRHYIFNGDDNLDEINSLPDLSIAYAKSTTKNYYFSKPDRMARVSAHIEEATFDKSRSVLIGEHETTIMQFTVPSSNFSAACSMAFFRPPITVTSELTGSLHAVQVWEILPSANSARISDDTMLSFSFKKSEEHMLGTLDLTKQAAMAVSQEFPCTHEDSDGADNRKRMFEFRCSGEGRCVIKYEVAEKLNMGFQLRRHI